jgi:cytochrome c oxidase subunit 1
MLGMPRRVYTYDAGQGWEVFNLMATAGTYLLVVATLFFVWNFIRSGKKGEIAGNDPWGAGTLEWSIPSPPPEYNFAQIPEVTSRYPLWDLKDPSKTAGIDHSHADALTITDAHAVPVHEETERHTAKELGIPMPFPTFKPFVAAFGILAMFSGLVFMRNDMFAVSLTVILSGAALWIGTLYFWLTSPLE